MKKMKKTALIITILMCMSLLAACGGGNTNTSAPAGSTSPSSDSESGAGQSSGASEGVRYAEEITILTDGIAVPHLNPVVAGTSTPGTLWTFKMGWDRLINSVGESQYEPMLATEWGSDDMKTWTFKLREDVYFHNGEKFTAADVVYTINRGKESTGTMAYSIWGYVEEATAIDEYTVEIVLSEVNVEFEYYVSSGIALIVNEKAIAEDPENGNLVGTGAYHVTEFVSNNYWVLERNDNYWGEPPITRQVTFRQIAEPGARTIMLMNGEGQICFGIPAEDQELFLDNPDYVTFRHTLNNPNPISFNMTDPITGDRNFRMAVASALNREEIVLATGTTYYILTGDGGMYGYEQPFRDTDIPMVPEDIEKAKEYLAASPYNGETLTITAAIDTFVRAAEVIQQQLSKIGVKTEIVRVDTPALPSLTEWGNNQLQMLVTSFQVGTNEAALRNLLYPRMLYNRMSYNNPEITALFDQASLELDREKRREIYTEIQEIVAEDPPYFLLWHSERLIFGVKGMGGFNLQADAFYDFRYIYWQLED